MTEIPIFPKKLYLHKKSLLDKTFELSPFKNLIMKKIGLILFTALLITSCGSDTSTTEKELELRAKELELKERELALRESGNSNNDVSSTDNDQHENNNSSSNSSNKRNSYTPPSSQKTEKDLKRELAIKECESPAKYLRKTGESLKGTYKNALSMKFDGFKVKFNIQNRATLVTFKNVKCRVVLSSNSGSNILVKNFTVNEFVRAGSYVSYSGEFACTNQQFKDTDRYSLEILGAECH